MVLVIDNYDSFTYNLVQYLGELKVELQVQRNDQITLDQIRELKPERILISPGPCSPRESGLSNEIIRTFGPRIPLFGVCLGHQCIGHTFGAEVVVNYRMMHGKTSPIKHNGKDLFAGHAESVSSRRAIIRSSSNATRCPTCLEITAETDEGEIMGVRHKELSDLGRAIPSRKHPDGERANTREEFSGVELLTGSWPGRPWPPCHRRVSQHEMRPHSASMDACCRHGLSRELGRGSTAIVWRAEKIRFALASESGFTEWVSNNGFHPTYELLNAKGRAQQALHQKAAAIAATRFGRQVFLRGVVEVSNFCRENCHYCGMRRDNRSLGRFRARHDQLAELLLHHRPASITDVNIQSGEDPVVVREVVIPLVKTLRRETPLGVSVCLGTLLPSLYTELREAGASVYIMKFETSDPRHYQRLCAPGTFEERINHIRLLSSSGWSVSSGFIVGLPDRSDPDLLANFRIANTLPLDGCSVSPFIPGEETPLANDAIADIDLTLNSMAALRLMRPDWVIPAVSALNLADPGSGYRRGLRTGANLVTINLTPSEFRGDYLLYKRDRFIMTEERLLAAIAAEDLFPSKQSLADFYQQKNRRPAAAHEAPVETAVV